MNLEIKRLSPGLAEDYLHFFDVTPHDDDAPGSKCYCVCWCGEDHSVCPDFSTEEKRREMAGKYIESGAIDGYLAYLDGKVVGWCNANDKSKCTKCLSWLMFMQDFDASDSERVKSVFCFVIAPEMQRKGIATRLLDRVCEDAEKEGFDLVESYPQKDFVSIALDFMGPAQLYKNAGFSLWKEPNGDRIVMRKRLK